MITERELALFEEDSRALLDELEPYGYALISSNEHYCIAPVFKKTAVRLGSKITLFGPTCNENGSTVITGDEDCVVAAEGEPSKLFYSRDPIYVLGCSTGFRFFSKESIASLEARLSRLQRAGTSN